MTTESQVRTAAITGAAGGLGMQFCRQLAEQGYDLLLIDRAQPSLDELAATITSKFDVAVDTRCVNLVDEAAVKRLVQHLESLSEVSLLVNNAGFGQSRYFVDIDIENHIDMVNLHVHTPVRLCHAVLPGMIQRGRGAIINVSSLSAWTPCAGIVQYSATKQYLVTFSEAVSEELKGTPVTIQALCPAFIRTEFFNTDAMETFDERQVPRWLWVTPEELVRCSLKRLDQVIVIPGLACRILGRLMRMPVAQPIVRRLAKNKQHKR